MKTLFPRTSALSRTCFLAVLACLVQAPTALAQSYCASDGEAAPVQLMERFINADCASCWADSRTPQAKAGQLALDWIAPGKKGEEAPLSVVATTDALARLKSLQQVLSAQTRTSTRSVKSLQGSTLRVSIGSPLAGYVGASIELKPIPEAARNRRWTAWLALVETLPAGTEGSPTERNLVRNLLQTPFDGRRALAEDEPNRFFESRAMNIAQGAKAERLRVIGWVEDEKGQIRAAAQSRCETTNR